MFGLPSRADFNKPISMPERYWWAVFDAHLKRYDSFAAGVWVGFVTGVSVVFLLLACSGRRAIPVYEEGKEHTEIKAYP